MKFEQIVYKDLDIYFMKMGNRQGYFFTKEGIDYWTHVDNEDDCRNVLVQNAQESIDGLLK